MASDGQGKPVRAGSMNGSAAGQSDHGAGSHSALGPRDAPDTRPNRLKSRKGALWGTYGNGDLENLRLYEIMGFDSYFICGTPRTGSTLLCALLKSSGVAGNPESYFRKQDETKWAEKWNLVSHSDDRFSFPDYLKSAIFAGQAENGVFAARIMWGTMDELVTNLARLYQHAPGKDIDLLTQAFGNSRFLYLKRQNVVAQAVSRLRAEQTDIWHVTDDSGIQQPVQEPRYDFERLEEFVKEAEDHNEAWVHWFEENKIEPHVILYENLTREPVAEAIKAIDFLGLSLPSAVKLTANNKRMADELSAAWIERFNSDKS